MVGLRNEDGHSRHVAIEAQIPFHPVPIGDFTDRTQERRLVDHRPAVAHGEVKADALEKFFGGGICVLVRVEDVEPERKEQLRECGDQSGSIAATHQQRGSRRGFLGEDHRAFSVGQSETQGSGDRLRWLRAWVLLQLWPVSLASDKFWGRGITHPRVLRVSSITGRSVGAARRGGDGGHLSPGTGKRFGVLALNDYAGFGR